MIHSVPDPTVQPGAVNDLVGYGARASARPVVSAAARHSAGQHPHDALGPGRVRDTHHDLHQPHGCHGRPSQAQVGSTEVLPFGIRS